MNETSSEATNLDFEGVAQAARLVAPVSSGSARSRRAPPPPPPSAPDAAALREWEAAAQQLEADWATPLDDEEVLETAATAKDVPGAPEEPMADAEEADSVTDTSELAEAELTAHARASAPDGQVSGRRPSAGLPDEVESKLDALAKQIAKSPRETPTASRLPPKPLPPPVRTPLPPLAPLPPSQRPSPLPLIPPSSAASLPAVAAPSLVEIRHSPVARRYYAQLAVAAVFGALLTIVFFALASRSSTPATTAAAVPEPAVEPVVASPPASPRSTAELEAIPPPPVKNLSVDELAREAPKPASTIKAPARPVDPAATLAPSPPPQPSVLAAEPAATKGILQITATPAANVAIDGRPLGMTPKIVRLSPGVHRVALIGPQGRRSQIVNVTAGRTTSIAVSF